MCWIIPQVLFSKNRVVKDANAPYSVSIHKRANRSNPSFNYSCGNILGFMGGNIVGVLS